MVYAEWSGGCLTILVVHVVDWVMALTEVEKERDEAAQKISRRAVDVL